MNYAGFDVPCACKGASGLGAMEESQIDALIANTVALARDIFPNQTQAAEEWISRRLMAYGIDYAKNRAGQFYGSVSEVLTNPFVVLGIGLFAGYLIFKRR